MPIAINDPILRQGFLDQLLKQLLVEESVDQQPVDPFSLETTQGLQQALPDRVIPQRPSLPYTRPLDLVLEQLRNPSERLSIGPRSVGNLAGITAPDRPAAPRLPSGVLFPQPFVPQPARGVSFGNIDLDGFIRNVARERFARKTFGIIS